MLRAQTRQHDDADAARRCDEQARFRGEVYGLRDSPLIIQAPLTANARRHASTALHLAWRVHTRDARAKIESCFAVLLASTPLTALLARPQRAYVFRTKTALLRLASRSCPCMPREIVKLPDKQNEKPSTSRIQRLLGSQRRTPYVEWATVNKESGGVICPAAAARPDTNSSSREGTHRGERSARPAAQRRASQRRHAATRNRGRAPPGKGSTSRKRRRARRARQQQTKRTKRPSRPYELHPTRGPTFKLRRGAPSPE